MWNVNAIFLILYHSAWYEIWDASKSIFIELVACPQRVNVQMFCEIYKTWSFSYIKLTIRNARYWWNETKDHNYHESCKKKTTKLREIYRIIECWALSYYNLSYMYISYYVPTCILIYGVELIEYFQVFVRAGKL